MKEGVERGRRIYATPCSPRNGHVGATAGTRRGHSHRLLQQQEQLRTILPDWPPPARADCLHLVHVQHPSAPPTRLGDPSHTSSQPCILRSLAKYMRTNVPINTARFGRRVLPSFPNSCFTPRLFPLCIRRHVFKVHSRHALYCRCVCSRPHP